MHWQLVVWDILFYEAAFWSRPLRQATASSSHSVTVADKRRTKAFSLLLANLRETCREFRDHVPVLFAVKAHFQGVYVRRERAKDLFLLNTEDMKFLTFHSRQSSLLSYYAVVKYVYTKKGLGPTMKLREIYDVKYRRLLELYARCYAQLKHRVIRPRKRDLVGCFGLEEREAKRVRWRIVEAGVLREYDGERRDIYKMFLLDLAALDASQTHTTSCYQAKENPISPAIMNLQTEMYRDTYGLSFCSQLNRLCDLCTVPNFFILQNIRVTGTD